MLADGPASPALKNGGKDLGVAAMDEIERWQKARQQLRNRNKQQKPKTPAQNPSLKSAGATSTPLEVKPTLQPVTPRVPTPRPIMLTKPITPTEPAPIATQPRKHTVVSGDSLWKITYKYFGNSNIQENLDAILATNPWLDPDEFLQPGMEIVIPLREATKMLAKPAAVMPVTCAPEVPTTSLRSTILDLGKVLPASFGS